MMPDDGRQLPAAGTPYRAFIFTRPLLPLSFSPSHFSALCQMLEHDDDVEHVVGSVNGRELPSMLEMNICLIYK